MTDRFDPKRSDFELTVELAADLLDRLGAYVGLKEDLEQLPDRPVDLLVRTAIDHPFFEAEVAWTEELLYAA